MASVRPMVTCIFCGQCKLASIEDVISKWVRYALDPTSSVTIPAEPSGATAAAQHLVVTLRVMVCEECNTGWMHDLEEKVKPFVKPMLTNKRGVDLDAAGQRDLARWAVMKVLLLEHCMRQQNPQLRASWTTLVTGRALAATRAGKSCGLGALTAVAYTPAGTPLLGGACARPGVAGIFAAAGRAWRAAGPALPGALARQTVTVLRLATTGSQTAALLEAGTGQHSTLMAAWLAGSGTRWTISPPFSTGGRAVAAASLGPGQTAALITSAGRGAVLAAGRWQLLPALPPGTVALAPAGGGTTDALAVHQATLTVWQLASPGGSWTTAQTISVPIQYGSSG